MGPDGDKRGEVTLVTLGPTGTCHERAAIEYMRFQGVEDFEIELIGDFFDGLERIRGKDNAFLIQCSAHPKVHEVTERYWAEVFVVDTFEAVPDAPVSRFVLEMKGGKKYSLLENSENLCQKPQRAIARFTAQNGKVDQTKPLIANQCGKKKGKKRSK